MQGALSRAGFVLLLSVGASAAFAAAAFTMLNVPPVGMTGEGGVTAFGASFDGHYVAFSGGSSGWCAGDDTPGFHPERLWLRDLAIGQTLLISHSGGGEPNVENCSGPRFSSDGDTVVFSGRPNNTVSPPAVVGEYDGLWAWDRKSGTVDRVDVSSTGTPSGTYGAIDYDVSADGRYVVFTSQSPGLVAEDTSLVTVDVFVRDRVARTTIRVNYSSNGVLSPIVDAVERCAISGDGKRVLFTSGSANVVAGVGGGLERVYLRRLGAAPTTELVSRTAAGAPAEGFLPSISSDGRYVAFTSTTNGIVAADGNGVTDVFIRDLLTGRTVWASAPRAGLSGATGWSYTRGRPALSADGRYLVYASDSACLAPLTAPNGRYQVYLFDRVSALSRVLSVLGSRLANDDCEYPSISPSGEWVYFRTFATNLTAAATSTFPRLLACRTNYNISGRVTRTNGVALAATSVRVRNEATGSERWTYSGTDGVYSVGGLGAGSYTVTACKAGYAFNPTSRGVTLPGDEGTSRWFEGAPGRGDGTRTYRALLVGVARYANAGLDLDWPTNDVEDLRSALLASRNWQARNITVLQNAKATREGIRKALQAMAAPSDADDVCLVFYSGHGDQGDDSYPFDEVDAQDELLAPYDTVVNRASSEIADDDFGHWINGLGTASYLVLLDCCYSGGHVKGPRVTGDFCRGFAEDFLPLARAGTRDLDDNDTGAVIAACTDAELAQEDDTLANGLLTHYLVEGADTREADANADGWIAPDEWLRYARPRVVAAAARLGYPPSTPAGHFGATAASLPVCGARYTPDLRLQAPGGAIIGAHLYSDVANHQVIGSVPTPAGKRVDVNLWVGNDSADGAPETVSLTGTGGNKRFTVRYYLVGEGGEREDVTSQVTGDGLQLASLAAGKLRRLILQVLPTRLAVVADWIGFHLDARFASDANRHDAGFLTVRVQPASASPAAAVTGLTALPTHAGAELTFALSAPAAVTVRVLNLAGRVVREVATQRALPAGACRILWDGRSSGGTLAPPGTYLGEVRASTAGGELSRGLTTVVVRPRAG